MLREALLRMDKEAQEGEEGPDIVEVANFFVANPDPSDEQFHQFAESKGYDPDEAEAVAYQLATIAAKFMLGGKAMGDGLDPDEVDPDQLLMGIEVEKEHTPDEETAARIALDHLAEIPDYYTRLKAMEDAAKRD